MNPNIAELLIKHKNDHSKVATELHNRIKTAEFHVEKLKSLIKTCNMFAEGAKPFQPVVAEFYRETAERAAAVLRQLQFDHTRHELELEAELKRSDQHD